MTFSSLEAADFFGRFEAVFQKGQAKAPAVSINWNIWDIWDK